MIEVLDEKALLRRVDDEKAMRDKLGFAAGNQCINPNVEQQLLIAMSGILPALSREKCYEILEEVAGLVDRPSSNEFDEMVFYFKVLPEVKDALARRNQTNRQDE